LLSFNGPSVPILSIASIAGSSSDALSWVARRIKMSDGIASRLHSMLQKL